MSRPAQTPEEIRSALKPILVKYAHRRLDKPIRLASGAETSEYFDGKQITMFPDRAVLFIRFILETVDLSRIQAVGGMSIGADPIVTGVSLLASLEKEIQIPAFFVRKEAKKHGLQKKIEGVDLKPGMNVLVVEDVVTKGGSTLSAIEAVESAGATVAHIVCLVDREAGGGKILSSKYPFTAAFKKSEIR